MGELKPFHFYQQIEDFSLKFIDVIYSDNKEKAIKTMEPRIRNLQKKDRNFFCIESVNKNKITI